MGKENVGMIGLGIMGKPMAFNLLKAGYHVSVYNRSVKPIEEMTKMGAVGMGSPKEVAGHSTRILTMLPDGPDVEQVILGPMGVLEGLQMGSIVIDMSSTPPAVAQKIAAEVERRGGEMLDAPVSGGETGAIQGTLAIMVGGKVDVFNKCRPLFEVLGKSIKLVGGNGAGQTAKLANQMIVAINIAALSEGLVFASKLGVDPDSLIGAIRGGLAGSAVMEAKAPKIINRDFKPGFRIRLHQKDLRNALTTAAEKNIPLPLTSSVQQMIGALVNDGKGELDHSAIELFVEGMAKTEVRRWGVSEGGG